MPRPTPATSAPPRLDIRPMAAAVRARNRREGPNVWAPLKPCVGWVRIAVNADRAPARAQARDDILEAKTPAIRAVSGAAADALRASPYLVRRRNTMSATTASGPRNSIAEYAGVIRSAPIWNVGSPEGSGYRNPAPAVVLMETARPTRSCPTPSVATT